MVPIPGPGELLLRVQTIGICGSDLSELDHGPVLTPLSSEHPVTGHRGPIVLGHEFSGVVEDSRSSLFRVGDLVACTAAMSCGKCRYCRAGRRSICPRYWAIGLHRNGGLAEYCVVPAEACTAAPDLTPDAAALAQPMAVAVHALKRSRITPGEAAMVIGTGGIGSFIVAAAKAMGVPVLACDLDPERLAIASRLGATETVLTDGVSPLDLDVHAEVIFEASGTPSGLSTAIQALSPGGRLVLVGIQGRPADVDLPRITIAEYELIGTNALDTPSDTSAALTLLQRQRENLEHLAPRVFPLTDAPAVFRESGAAVKTLLSPAIETPRPSVMN